MKSAPSKSSLQRLYGTFINHGSLNNTSHASRQRTRRSDENIEAVRASIEGTPRTSSYRRSQELGIARTTLRRIIRSDLKMFPYKIQLTQKLKPADYPKRLDYAKWAVEILRNELDFWRKIIMPDEAHFQLNGDVNKQNCRFYATENPQLIEEQHLFDQKVTVWCGVCAEKIIGPLFFENDEGVSATIHGERYRAIIRDFVMPIIEENDMEGFWFQQDGATCHTSRATIDFLNPLFPARLISKNGDFPWPPRSPDFLGLSQIQGIHQPKHWPKRWKTLKKEHIWPLRRLEDIIFKK